jgi:hypothetical protein
MLCRLIDFGLGEHGVSSSTARRAARFIVLSEDVAPSSTREREIDNGARLVWRIVAANNRPLGRSATTFTAFDRCLEAATQLHLRADDARGNVTFDSASATWNWSVSIDGATVAVSVRSYVRRIECARALAQFMAVAREGVPVIDEVRYLGAGGLGLSAPPRAAVASSRRWAR